MSSDMSQVLDHDLLTTHSDQVRIMQVDITRDSLQLQDQELPVSNLNSLEMALDISRPRLLHLHFHLRLTIQIRFQTDFPLILSAPITLSLQTTTLSTLDLTPTNLPRHLLHLLLLFNHFLPTLSFLFLALMLLILLLPPPVLRVLLPYFRTKGCQTRTTITILILYIIMIRDHHSVHLPLT